MNILLQRFASGDESTLGAMFWSSEHGKAFECFTLEDEHREQKVPGETRIPAGIYEIKLRAAGGMHKHYSAKFPWHVGMLWLQDVPGFEWIYIHPGNTDKHTEGCILVGDGAVSNVIGRGSISASQQAYERLYKKIVAALQSGEPVYIHVSDYA